MAQSTEALSSPLGDIKTSDIARLMELFQVCLSASCRAAPLTSIIEFSASVLEFPAVAGGHSRGETER